MPERKTTATSAGYHFLSLYQSCRWRFYLRHVLHLVPEKTSRYLLFGQAFHAAKEAFYLAGGSMTKDAYRGVGLERLRGLEGQYPTPEQFEQDYTKMAVMCDTWYDTHAADEFALYRVIAVEPELLIHLPAGYIMTVRPDVVVQERSSGIVYLFETKTTSRSVNEMAHTVSCQEQVDAQTMGTLEAMPGWGLQPACFGGVIPDISYTRQSVSKAARTMPILRSTKELADTKLSFAGLFAEISQKLYALEQGQNVPEAFFDRNGAWCGAFGCEYASICRSRFHGAPPGFRVEAPEV